MGSCNNKIQKDSTIKQTEYGTTSSAVLTTIKSHIQYFDQIDLEQLNYPDLSVFLRKHIKNYRIVEEGKTWLAVNEILSVLNKKSSILIRDFNPSTDAAIELIYKFKQLMMTVFKLQEVYHTFDEETIEKFQYFQCQLVQLSLECLIAVNTLILHKELWWNEEYFRWRKNYISSTFQIEKQAQSNNELVGPIYDFIQILLACSYSLGNWQNNQEISEVEVKAQQEFLQQFYNQMKLGFIQNQSFIESIVANEIISQQIQIANNIKTYTLIIKKK